MCPGEVGTGELPDIARVLAEQMTDRSSGLECRKAAVACCLLSPGGRAGTRRRPRATASLLCSGAMRNPDRVEIEEVASLAHQEVDDVVGVVEPIAHGVRHRVGLGPDHLVADDPAVVCHRQ